MPSPAVFPIPKKWEMFLPLHLDMLPGIPDKGLESLANVTPADNVSAQRLIDEGKITVALSGISSRIFMEATFGNNRKQGSSYDS